ncbi:MAG: ankyrin repeat domain-containing protein [Candidatus Dependentiae bacterium]|nr:ankyrin repeat domain-containing protein [Candidatus Dependentiae bacterium]
MTFIQNYRLIAFCTTISLLTNTICPMHNALFAAINDRDIPHINALLDSKSDINKKNSAGASALMHATEKNFPEIVQLLIDRGGLVNDTNPHYGFTPLMLASLRGIAPMVDLLLAKNADPTVADDDNITPLQVVLCAQDRPEDTDIIQMLTYAASNSSSGGFVRKHTSANIKKRDALLKAQEDVKRAEGLSYMLTKTVVLKQFLTESLVRIVDEYAALPYKS